MQNRSGKVALVTGGGQGIGRAIALRPANDGADVAIADPDRESVTDANDPTATVRRMFAAFAARDLDALLETVHPDSRWTYVGANPRSSKAEFTGRAAVRKFFARILERLDMTAFHADEFIVQGATVVVIGAEAGIVRASGQPFRNEWVQKYVVRDGLITRMAEWNVQVEPRT